MSHRFFIVVQACLLALSCFSHEAAGGEPRATDAALERPPNVVFILCDDLGYGDLGCYGHPTIETPRLDQMAREGQRWTSFYAPASVCSPSRAGCLTGRLPIRSGCAGGDNRRLVFFDDCDQGMPQNEITIAEVLGDVGYRSICIGKWHLGHLPEFLPTAQGFDEFYGIPYSNDMGLVKGRPNYAALSRTTWDKQVDSKWFDVPLMHSVKAGEVVELEKPVQQPTLTKRLTDKAVEFIGENKDQPFFLYLAHPQPHVPLFASNDFRDSSIRGLYGDVLKELDDSVGRVLDELKQQGLDQNTLVIFTSDNGPWQFYSYHGGTAGILNGAKASTWEGGMRVPGIFWMPGKIKAGETIRGIGSGLDLLPTIANLCGGTMPTDREIDGVDLSPTLFESKASPRDELFYYRGRQLWAIRKGKWKAAFTTVTPKGVQQHSPPLLWNLDVDPSERYNINGHADQALAMLKQMKIEHESQVKPGPELMSRKVKK
ncbi:MAG: sulfatase [Planctomycetota bacterium]